jgi:hypothetical protein
MAKPPGGSYETNPGAQPGFDAARMRFFHKNDEMILRPHTTLRRYLNA